MFNYLIQTYIASAREATTRLKNSMSVLLGLLALFIVPLIFSGLIAGLGILGGFLVSIYQAVAVTYYLGWLRESSEYKNVRIEQLKIFDWGLFQSVISVLFIIYLFQWGVQMLTTGSDGSWAFAILQMLVVVLLNSLPETIYISRREGMDSIQEAFNFTTRNWIEWYLPYLVMLSPILLLEGYSLSLLLAQSQVFFPALPLIAVPSVLFPNLQLLTLPLGVVLAHWFMLFRARLFSELESGGRRQRIFKARMG